jgi:methionyl-tRNA synthetase
MPLPRRTLKEGRRHFSGTLPEEIVPGAVVDPCDVCGKPGSTCTYCGTILCHQHNLNPHIKQAGHEPEEHLTAPLPPTETEEQQLVREIKEMRAKLIGSPLDRLRKMHAQLKTKLEEEGLA